MKLAVPVFSLRTTGGIERYIWEMVTQLALRGHDITCYAPNADRVPRPPGVEGRAVGRDRAPNSVMGAFDLVSFGPRASLSVRHRQPDAICYGPLGSVMVPGVITAMSVHAAWIRDRQRALGGPPPSMYDRALVAIERISYRLPYLRYTALSSLCADDVADCFGLPRESIRVVAPAIDPVEFAPRTPDEYRTARAAYGLSSDQYVVGIAANYAFERKRVAAVIEASARAGATVLVAGVSDRQLSEYQQLALGLGVDVRFLGTVDPMRPFYSALDVFTLPSVNEAYGIAIHEAMGCGVATVASDRCGAGRMLEAGRDALIVDHRDVDDLADALERLRDDTFRSEVAAAGTAWAHRRTWVDAATEMEAVLRDRPAPSGWRRSR
jgi:glycosyltransferase involved in cell wall biosynthesis